MNIGLICGLNTGHRLYRSNSDNGAIQLLSKRTTSANGATVLIFLDKPDRYQKKKPLKRIINSGSQCVDPGHLDGLSTAGRLIGGNGVGRHKHG